MMKKYMDFFKKILTFIVIILFIFIGTISSNGYEIKKNFNQLEQDTWKLDSINNNDTTPPYTNCTFDPTEPNGENGWYVCNVSVELTAKDDLSGVKEIRISICGNPELIIPGNHVQFLFEENCKNYFVDYWAIDNVGNVEPKNRFYVNIDKKAPEVYIYYEVDRIYPYREIRYIIMSHAEDITSGMDRVEFYTNSEHQKTVQGPGPEYMWIWKPNIFDCVKGFILRPEITEESVKFYALFVRVHLGNSFPIFYAYAYDKAGNMNSDSLGQMDPPFDIYDFLVFQNVALPYNYSGYIGKFFIDATFDTC